MNLLLDTHVFIWWDQGRRLAPTARRAIQKADLVFVSAATAWEISIKVALGRLRTTRTVEDAVRECGFEELPVNFRHAAAVAQLPLHHRDPFDRLLIAQATADGLTIVSRDPVFVAYAVPMIQA